MKSVNMVPKKRINPYCPECEHQIDHLENVQSGHIRCEYKLDRKGKLKIIEGDFDVDCNYNVWECPECNAPLFEDEDEAVEFLANKKSIVVCGRCCTWDKVDTMVMTHDKDMGNYYECKDEKRCDNA